MKRVNGRVLFSLTGGGLYKEAGVLSPEISPRKVSFPFLVTSFSHRLNPITDDKVCQGENGDDNFEKTVAVPIYSEKEANR